MPMTHTARCVTGAARARAVWQIPALVFAVVIWLPGTTRVALSQEPPPATESAPPEAEASTGDRGEPSIEKLQRRLEQTEDIEEQIGLLVELAEHGRDAEPILCRYVAHSEPRLRLAAMRGLYQLPRPYADQTYDALFDVLYEEGRVEGVPVWIGAAQLLGRSGKPAVQRCIAQLKTLEESGDVASDVRAERQTRLCTILYEAGPEAAAAVDLLARIAEEQNATTLIPAVAALGKIGKPSESAIPQLRAALYAENFHAQYWACRALAAIGPDAAPAIPDLLDRLKNGNTSVKRNAAMALGDIGTAGDNRVVPALIEALDDPAQFVREQAAWALGKLGEKAKPAVDKLTRAVEEKTVYPRSAPVWALWKITGQSPRADVVLEEFRDPPYRGEAAAALIDFGDDAPSVLPQLRQWAETGDEELRQAARDLLEDLQPAAPPTEEPKQSTGNNGS